MILLDPSFALLRRIDAETMYSIVETAARTCYQSGPTGNRDTFLRMLRKRKHLSVFEHVVLTVEMVVDRAVSHELVRHRIASYSQESQRYVAYREHVSFVKPWWWKTAKEEDRTEKEIFWLKALCYAEEQYHIALTEWRMKPEDARSMLPNATATKIVMTANLREWLHVFALRTSQQAHPDIRYIMKIVQQEFMNQYPLIFKD